MNFGKFSWKVLERVWYWIACFCAYLVVIYSFCLAKLFDSVGFYSALLHIAFVCQNAHYYAGLSIFLNRGLFFIYLIYPELLNISECLLICQIIDQKNTMSSFIIRTRDSSKSLLSSRIPYLQFYNIVIYFQRPLL